ncbi:MAG: 30S ribosomal protein S6 [Phycisphaeraceae bacterium]
MSDAPTSLYEGLFLISQSAAADLDGAMDHVRSILGRAEAEVIGLQKWEERRLAYPIKGQRRGTYLLSFFRAKHDKLTGLDRDCNLSDNILRSMFLRADHVGETELTMFKEGNFLFAKPEPVKETEGVGEVIDETDLSEGIEE